ncbi:exonuclease V a 5' deoxyribonuclease-domain-containing protein [Ampelomyces quisqualis]|uniref:Exonuclease V a 5' deoxyribonuclease-domain-containing protein n=1 Tax=Ampelomyces quisqualis TaxID=50730 RepID=A0A6A5QN88_AMPQU|nr:exonuclease V a 5' deoxyribonuclease-domain-containing protein [Ampelomyces quisqualis]
MASSTTLLTNAVSDYGSDVDIGSVAALSDYGSDTGLDDIDEDSLLADVLETIQVARSTERDGVLPSVEFQEGELEDEDQHVGGVVQIHKPSLLRVARGKAKALEQADSRRDMQSSPLRDCQALEVEYDERSRRAWSVPLQEPTSPLRPPTFSRYHSVSSRPQAQQPLIQTTEAVAAVENDTRPPLERFRTKPKKPLSVTDLVSPAWCELQYLYMLSQFGRKPRTQAMRNGSKIHQKLEDEVHTTVPVQVHSKEDRFGLRMWNAISGLRCLRETGLTRELEVWGVLEGQVVNGIIDELSYTCPNPVFEEQLERARAEKDGGVVPLPRGQTTIAQAFAKSTPQATDDAWVGSLEPDRQVYIADVKTRSVRSVPAGASLRPTWMQLMLYRKLLESLSLNTVDAETVLARYDVRPLEPFTPSFLDGIGGIGPDNEAANYPNLLSLWALLVTQMQVTFPSTSLSPILRAEFRYAKTGDVIGSELIVYETEVIDKYISEEMAFWKGTREANGVELEDAFKCRICDFAENCTWRKTKVEEATEKSRLRRLAREKSAV